jgi:hypothetical protein
VLRFLKIITPVTCVIPLYDERICFPKEGELFRRRNQNVWSINIDKPSKMQRGLQLLWDAWWYIRRCCNSYFALLTLFLSDGLGCSLSAHAAGPIVTLWFSFTLYALAKYVISFLTLPQLIFV